MVRSASRAWAWASDGTPVTTGVGVGPTGVGVGTTGVGVGPTGVGVGTTGVGVGLPPPQAPMSCHSVPLAAGFQLAPT
ncbi:hypothetical protein FAZ21_06185 [Chitiniphilus eburneus]|uniref:Uncharacterized protein n=1 Tax=Chitiniphilus eburneus TaxID=2571148 RepID=A0A4U0Q3M3_9NEIS|nr:hypothetical protein FAZ21_06185 [Chitiniphilus eburneus]